MNSISLGLGEHCIAREPEITIKAYALGSCVALCLLHQARGVYGMAHIVLPDSIVMPEQAAKLPCYFADTALQFLLREFVDDCGQQLADQGLVAKMAGGAKILKNTGGIDIGKRLVATLTILLQQYRIPIVATEVGGAIPRNIILHSGNGEIVISSPGEKDRLL